jgi:hypothetical protein
VETADILQQIRSFNGEFPRAALEAAMARKDEITPELLRLLDDAIERAAELDAEGGYMAHLYAMFLLAQFREVRAYPLFVRFASLPSDRIYSMLGDVLTEDFGRMLASVCGRDMEGIRSIIENPELDEWVRAVSFNAILTLVAEQQLDRDEAVRYLADLFRGKLEREPSEAWNSLVAAASDLYPAELMDDIRQAYGEGLIDPGNIGIGDVERDLALGIDRVLRRLQTDRHHRMVNDTIKETEWWACFKPEKKRELPVEVPSSIERTHPKVGRNEPCPCGSGKKFKKCCGY